MLGRGLYALYGDRYRASASDKTMQRAASHRVALAAEKLPMENLFETLSETSNRRVMTVPRQRRTFCKIERQTRFPITPSHFPLRWTVGNCQLFRIIETRM